MLITTTTIILVGGIGKKEGRKKKLYTHIYIWRKEVPKLQR
jgi:hypothetical protein